MRYPNHHRGLWLSLALLLVMATAAMAQNGTISGTVKAKAGGESLSGANVAIVGTTMGAATDANGNYTIANVPPGSYRLRVTFIGYEEASQNVRLTAGQTETVNFTLSETSVLGDPVVVSASRRVEKLTEAPASITVVTSSDLAKSSGLTYGEGLQKARGVDVYRTGVDGVGINARGFMTAYSYRMQLMADGKNGMLPGAGLAAGNLLPVARDDIERLETVLGPSSALYGPNAHNGLVNIVTKDPRDSRGTTLTLGGGTRDTRIARLRHAGTAGERVAYKVNGEFTKATDFIKNDPVGRRADGTVVYEDPDPDLESLRLDGSAYLNLLRDTDLIFSYGYSNTNSIGTTNVGRNQIVDWVYQYAQLRLSSKHFFAQGYLTKNDAGRTYAIDNVAALLLANPNLSKEQAIDRIKFIDDSKRYNLEVQGNVDWQGFHLIGGVNHEDSRPVSKGSYLVDTTGFEIKIKQTGFYGQVERELGEHFKVVLAGRYDTHDNYASQFSPRAGLVYKVTGKGSFRLTYNKAFQAPAILQQYLYLPFGSAAGVPIILRGNGRGLTLANGGQITPLDVERNETFEAGYKGLVTNNLTVDINAYSSKYDNFISPLTTVGSPFPPISSTVVKMGDGAITKPEITLTYLNFGEVAIKGVDVGLGYQLNRNLGFWINYSYIDPEDIADNLENDLNGNQVVDVTEYEALSFNTPKKKYNVGIALSNIFTKGTYASLSMRHVDKYDFISGRHRATAARRVPGAWQFVDRGPLGGFETFDLNLSYAMQNGVTINVSATNIFNAPLREMVGSPEIRRIVVGEVKYNFNFVP
ncbi:MAG: TonB-dependent receptor [candidate division KSB1 bacterium]|nr:TonB-dependent receptor [candidate division KSB1 bacterium]MDZ7365304.1 TonB-dependent receptor [candidate division KSB1 bacterium]MDZ7403171.1 TonB-dependent receptor [candidate division KSB1 bacterium]